MSEITVGPGGEIMLPAEVLDRCGLRPDRAIRLVETRGGLLLVPMGKEPMDPALAEEIASWQALAAEGLSTFPYDEAEGG